MSNTTANITNEYTSLANRGKLHDFTASELYEVGSAVYTPYTKGVSYVCNGQENPSYSDFRKYDDVSTANITTSDLYGVAGLGIRAMTYYVPVPEQQINQDGEGNYIYTRDYHIKLSAEQSSGLYQKFAQSKPDSKYVDFIFQISQKFSAPDPVSDAYQSFLNNWSLLTAEDLQQLATINIFSRDYEEFIKFLTQQSQNTFSAMTTTDTPLAMYLDQKYKDELEYRFFKSVNVTATKDNIFYKIIDSNPEDTIDRMVLFEDPIGRYGNQLYSTTSWSPYKSDISFVDTNNEPVTPGDSIETGVSGIKLFIPRDFNDVAQTPLYTHGELQHWTNYDAKYVYAQILQIRFKRMLAGDVSLPSSLDNLVKTLAATDLDAPHYALSILEIPPGTTGEIYKAYETYLTDWYRGGGESITISANGNVVFTWVGLGGTPQTCTVSNWTSRFSIVNPQHLEKSGKRVLDPSVLNNFAPYREWYRATYGGYPAGEINQTLAATWFNSLTQNQFAFWINPNTKEAWSQMSYDIPGQEPIIVKRGTGAGQWNGISSEFLADCGGYNQIIWGCGLTPDFMYPVVDISRPTPNTATECLVYCNTAGYQSIKLAFVNSTVEEYLLARFKANVNTNRRQVILDDVNDWATKNMIFPDNVKCAYFANDMNDLLNCAGFRVAYIPNLVNVIRIVSIILCSFIGILCLVICFVIIKRYVENNRVNIGIMRANGIKKWKIGVSLLPFALFPALVGGIAAYFTGLGLQAAALSLFSNYWMLPTPLIKFSWMPFLGCIFLPFLVFALICFITTLIVLRVNSVELMKPGSEFKTNSFSRIAKKPFKHFGVMTRFRVALAFNSISRLLMLAAMSCLTMSSLVFAFTTFDKLNASRVTNSSQFDYNFNIQLTTPTTSGGPYVTYDYAEPQTDAEGKVKGLGWTDPSQYYFNVSWDTTSDAYSEYPWHTEKGKTGFSELTKWYSNDAILSLTQDRYIPTIGSNGNLMLPTAADATGQTEDLMYLQNKASSRLTLDYNIGVPGIASSNPWEIALALMPANSRNLAADSFNNIINEVGKRVYEAIDNFVNIARNKYGLTVSDTGLIYWESDEQAEKVRSARNEAASPWFKLNWHASVPIIDPDDYWYCPYHTFLIQNKDGDNVSYTLNKDFEDIGYLFSSFSVDFLSLLTTIYTDEELIKMEYPISYGVVPLNWDWTPDVKKDETYTYITGNFKEISNGHAVDESSESTIEGIIKDSQFIKLTDNRGNNLNDWLFDENYLNSLHIDDKVNPIVANAYAAHKYGLRVGDQIKIDVTNTADRYEQNIEPASSNVDSNVAIFKVIGISQGTNGEAFYTTQEIANDILGLPNGKSWNKTHKYMMWSTQDWGETASTLPSLIDLAGDEQTTIYSFADSDFVQEPIITHGQPLSEVPVPVGFNGIYTENKTGKPITAGLSLYSYTGMYPGASVYQSQSNNKFTEILSYGANLSIANIMIGWSNPEAFQMNAQYLSGDIDLTTYRSFIENTFIKNVVCVFGSTTMITAICGAMDVAASDLIYNNLISTFDLAQTSIMSIIIPITIIIVAIISNLIINDSKRMAAMLKALGYSDIKNLMSILALFVPTIVIGLALAVPLSFGLTLGYQSIIFNTANILVDVTQKWWYYIASIGGIGLILVGTYAIGYVSLKRDRLVDQIK